MQIVSKPFRTALEAAVAYLIGNGTVKKDIDIVEALDMSKGTFSAYKSGKTHPSENFIQKFENTYDIKLADFQAQVEGRESGEAFLENRRNHKNSHPPDSIPIFEDAPFTLSNIESYRDQTTMEPDFWVTIPGLRKCNYGCRATGDSMHPLIRNHALVVGEEVTDLSFILFGDIYIVQTKNNIETIKYLHPHETDTSMLVLVPYNEKAKSTPIRKEDILKLYRAKAVFNVL